MADEIRVTAGLQVNNAELSFNQNFGTVNFDQSAAGGPTPGMVTIAITEEQITLSELSTPGWVIMKNLDTVNYVEWGYSTTVYGGKLGPTETAGPFRLNQNSIFLKANTAPCKVVIYALEA